jgi:hypothetical protein
VRRDGAKELVGGYVVDVDGARGGTHKKKRAGEGDGENRYWLAVFEVCQLGIHISESMRKAYSNVMRHSRLLLSSSATRMRLTPVPPMASIICPACFSVRWRKRLTWYIEPFGEAAKNKCLVISQLLMIWVCGSGRWSITTEKINPRALYLRSTKANRS